MTATPRTTEHPISPIFTERWSPRALTGEAIAPDTLLSFLEAARWAPSASNIQPWRFVFGHAGTPAFQSILDGLVPFNQGWANKASALIVVMSQSTSLPPGKTERTPNPWHSFDSGSAWMQLALQASLSGWVTHGMGGFVADTLRANLGIPAHVSVEAVVAVGKKADPAGLPEMLRSREGPSGRLPLAAIAAEGRYSFGD
jgi:nitroreductase